MKTNNFTHYTGKTRFHFISGKIQNTSLKRAYPTKKKPQVKQIPGFTIAFLGIDGSGKTTIINRVTPLLQEVYPDKVYYEHLRPNWIPTLAGLFGKKEAWKEADTDPHFKKQSGLIGSILRFGYYFLDYTLGYYLKILPGKVFESYVWIFDRYYYEYLIDPLRTRISLPKWVFELGLLFIPEPDLIICLGTIPKIVHTRKPEMSMDEITRQMYALSNFCKRHKNTVWVDTSCTIQHSVDRTMQVIYERMGNSFNLAKA